MPIHSAELEVWKLNVRRRLASKSLRSTFSCNSVHALLNESSVRQLHALCFHSLDALVACNLIILVNLTVLTFSSLSSSLSSSSYYSRPRDQTARVSSPLPHIQATKPETRYTRARPIDPDPMIDKVWLLLDYYCRSKIELQICHSCSLGTADTCPALALTANVFQCHVPGLATPELRVRHIS